MRAAEVVLFVVFAFFLVGVMVGIAVVYALSARMPDAAHHRSRFSAANTRYLWPAHKAGKD
jgi:hypothetical protein